MAVGPIIILCANAFFTGSFSLSKWLTTGTAVWVIMWFRFLAGPMFLGPYCAVTKHPLPMRSWPLLGFRVLCGISAMSSLFFAFKYGDIAKSTLIFELSIVWTVIIEAILFKKRLHAYSLASLPVAFIGLMLVLDVTSFSQIQVGDAFALLGSFFNAGVYLSLKKLRDQYNTVTVVFWTYLLSSLIILVPASSALLSLKGPTLIGLLTMCAVGFVGQMLMTLGFKYSSASVSSLFMMSIVPFTAISGAVFFNEVFTQITILGMAMVVVSLLVVARWR